MFIMLGPTEESLGRNVLESQSDKYWIQSERWAHTAFPEDQSPSCGPGAREGKELAFTGQG